ncbi:SPOSA6832_01653 [Sporobolomyces salmonicolor]|uniref:SPOSA6832_01653-mRNA-1:cds n=1 Tax=Sporidiobolus salmonicolor TaxID=5005 RepID=A0A0D6EJZ2_SPOSA|nr:SPOSA6832_01653 [Sporobolomyces salmonicolor]
MEDAHSFVYDFAGVRGQGYFGVFDGHAGKKAAEWCGLHFHEYLLDNLRKADATPIPQLLNATFHAVDAELSALSASEGTTSGCTAVTCFLRLEDASGNAAGEGSGVGSAIQVEAGQVEDKAGGALATAETKGVGMTQDHPAAALEQASEQNEHTGRFEAFPSRMNGGSRAHRLFTEASSPASTVKSKIKSILTGNRPSSNAPSGNSSSASSVSGASYHDARIEGPAEVVKAAKRTLYTANAGDARAVLARNGNAVRLSHDHKATDAKEAARIDQAGGFVMNQRVNGYLAVTRALGDSAMKQFVVGSPYTTETTLGPEDEWLIIACDGLWDVCTDQQAVDLIRGLNNPQEASDELLQHALNAHSTDNISVIVVALHT